MVKTLPVLLVFMAMVSVVVYLRFFRDTKEQPSPNQTSDLSQAESSGSGSLRDQPVPPFSVPQLSVGIDERIRKLEEAVAVLGKRTSGAVTQSPSNLEMRLRGLETTVASLQAQVASLPPSVTPTKNAPLYIPLGYGGSTNDLNWFSFDTYEVSLDPAEYGGYSNMQLEVTMKLIQSVGTAYVRLYDLSGGSGVAGSEISTTSEKPVLLVSSAFKLPPGKKTYRLQAKTSLGFELQVQNARIKVNF